MEKSKEKFMTPVFDMSKYLKNGYSSSELHGIIRSHKNISDEEQQVLLCQLSLFIGISDKILERIAKENITYIAEEIGYEVPD